ncbi:MAG: hypothetical protein H0T66_02725, partial [Geodermatophilaceae bacterium]|nr:hypothetical protein [Geodermatophilaceae bacterium]
MTVTIEQETVDAAEAAVEAGEAASLSAWVATAMAQRAQREHLKAVLADIRAGL